MKEQTNDPKLVSVLLPCCDQTYALQTRVIPSVLAQTHGDWELIVVSERQNNAPMRAVVAEFGDPRISYAEIARLDAGSWNVEQRRHAAHARALNLAQDLAAGSVLFLLDEDSEYLPDHLQASIEALENDSADLVYGPATVYDRNTGTQTVEIDEALGSVDPATVGYTKPWQADRFPEGGDGSPRHAKLTAILTAGGRSVGLTTPQIVSYGDDATGRVRVSMPSFPPTERLHELVESIAGSRRLSNNGPTNAKLEVALEEYIGVRHVVTAASGDTALGMAMIYAAGHHDDRTEVVLPSYTFPSTVNSVVRAGLTPVFCDIEPDTLCASAATMAPLITERTLALVPVLAHGAPCEMSALEDLARESGALLISDAAAALGATIGERKVGTYGDMEMFSLSSTKVLTAGEGGFLSLRDDTVESRLREIGRYGLDDNFTCVSTGVNGRLAEWPAGLALAGMDQIEEWLAARRRTATQYEQGLADQEHLRVVPHRVADRIGTAKDVVLVMESPDLRDDLADRLLRNRIETRPYFRPVHVMSPFKHLVRNDLEVTNQLADRMLSLPITNEIPESTTEHVIAVLKHELRDLVAEARRSR
ncbi:MAG: perosamine synthetase [Mycobacterium sp.]|nr:perosamine synthetase [Mycobacterium sp.]